MARPDGHIFWYNRRWFEFTGTNPAEMDGWGWKKVHDSAILPEVLKTWRHALETREPWEHTFPLRRHDGVFRWFLSGHALLDAMDKSHSGSVRIRTSPSNGKALRNAIVSSKASARLARTLSAPVFSKTEFLATLSTNCAPRSMPFSWTQLLRAGNNDETSLEEGLETIERNARARPASSRTCSNEPDISGKTRLDVQPIDLWSSSSRRGHARAGAAGKQVRNREGVGSGPDDVRRSGAVATSPLESARQRDQIHTQGSRVNVVLERVNSHVEISVSDNGRDFRRNSSLRLSTAFGNRTPPRRGVTAALASAYRL